MSTAAGVGHPSVGTTRRGTAATTSDASATEAFRERTQSKLDLATALAHLGQSNYEKAARGFLKVKNIKSLDHWAQVRRPFLRVLTLLND